MSRGWGDSAVSMVHLFNVNKATLEVLGGVYILACVTWKSKDFSELIDADTLCLGWQFGWIWVG